MHVLFKKITVIRLKFSLKLEYDSGASHVQSQILNVQIFKNPAFYTRKS